jgi:hypothetical protein
MKKAGRYILLFAAFAFLFTASCAKKEPVKANKKTEQAKSTEKPSATSQDGVQHKVLSFNLEGLTDKGEKKWDVNGESAEAISENEVKLDNIVAKAYGEEAQAVITADQGVYDKTKNNVKLQKNVKATIESTSGMSGGFGDFSGQGSGKPKVGAGGKDQKKTKTVITCDGSVLFDYERNIANFTDNVHVDSEDGSIIADKITVNLDSDTKQVKEIVAEGNVKIKRGENMTYSEKATYDAVTKKVSLAGRPRLVIYQEGDSGGVDTSFMGGDKEKK